jgi:CubicO group peptidase (beta-lactamase class C family)
MTSARQDDVYEIVPNRSRGYQLGPDKRVRNCGLADTSNKIPGGGMLATPEDLVRFAIAVQRGVLLKKETVEQMFTPPRLADGSISQYALGWNVIERDGRKWVAHSGSQQGVSTLLATVPAQGLSVAVMANLERADLNPLVFRIAGILLQ